MTHTNSSITNSQVAKHDNLVGQMKEQEKSLKELKDKASHAASCCRVKHV